MSNQSEARKLLTHYFSVAIEDLSSDCRAEIGCIVDFIIQACEDKRSAIVPILSELSKRVTELEGQNKKLRREIYEARTLASGESLE